MITFAIPYYKNRELLHRAIRSVLAQTSPDWKLLVCDDGPDGQIIKLVESFADSRMRYVHNGARLGMVGNWNRCLDLVNTPYVTLLHADDELEPHYYSTMQAGWKAHPTATALFCRARIIDDKSRPVFSFPDFYKRLLTPRANEPLALEGEAGIGQLLRGCFLFCPTACFRKEALGPSHFSPQWQMVQDLELWTRLLGQGAKLVQLPQVAYAYRRHSANSTVEYTANLTRFEEEAKLYGSLAENLKARGWIHAAAIAKRATVLKLNLAYCIVQDIVRFEFAAAFQKARFLLKLR